MENIKRVDAFLTAAGGCFLSTAEDGRPHDRPLGFHLMRGDRIYFLLTNRKDVYYQMRRNPQVEVTARKGKDWLRYYGKAVFEPDYSLAETLMRAVPQLKDLYGEDAGERLEIFHLEDATVEFRNMTLLNERFALNDTGAKRSEDIGYTLGLANPVKLKERIEAGQFLVYYQPQISLQTERLAGAEALVRFADEKGTFYPPDAFIPVLERARVISHVDFFVFERVCQRLKEWNALGLPVVPVSTNFSRYTVAEAQFVDRLARIRSHYGVPAEQIKVEVTETAEAEDRRAFKKAVAQLQERGFPVAIDDFGVSNANMLLLMEVNFQILKIDKRVVDMLGDDTKTKMMLTALTNMCHHNGIRVVAEGAETREQVALLKEVNCDMVQGYVFSKPLPEAQFEETLRAGRA